MHRSAHGTLRRYIRLPLLFGGSTCPLAQVSALCRCTNPHRQHTSYPHILQQVIPHVTICDPFRHSESDVAGAGYLASPIDLVLFQQQTHKKHFRSDVGDPMGLGTYTTFSHCRIFSTGSVMISGSS